MIRLWCRASNPACVVAAAVLAVAGLAGPASAQGQPQQQAIQQLPPASQPARPPAKPPESLVLYFDLGSATVRPQDEKLLDQASRLYRDGKPIVMLLSGSSDAVGPAAVNLALSERRANAVLRGLVDRGIPVERFQILGKGETDPAVPAANGNPEPRNRRVEITWR